MHHSRPTISITCDIQNGRACVRREYADAVLAAGGTPILLSSPSGSCCVIEAHVHASLSRCDGLIFTGGGDPATEPFGEPTHPSANLVHPDRQRFETALLSALIDQPEIPVLGVCLGMQMMALCAGGRLDQHMLDTTQSHADHMDDAQHSIIAVVCESVLFDRHQSIGSTVGSVTSWHRQSVIDAGTMRIVAKAGDGIVEAIDDPARPFYLGVQWHPERSADQMMGKAIFQRLVESAAQPALR